MLPNVIKPWVIKALELPKRSPTVMEGVAMAAPEILSAVLNKTSYTKGEQMILTVRARDLDEQAFELTIVVKTLDGIASTPATVTAVVDELGVAVSDSTGRSWTQASRVGDTWTFTATA